MAFTQFARDQFIRVLETNETASMGGYKMGTDTEIDQIEVWLNVEGSVGGSETLQVEVFGSGDTDVPLYSSDVVTLSSVIFNEGEVNEFTGVSDSLCSIIFTFNRGVLTKDVTYFLKLKSASYTRNADTFYIGYVFDNPEPINTRSLPGSTGAKAIIVGFE